MSIGLKFIIEIDKWRKNNKSSIIFKEENEQIDEIFTSKEPLNHNYLYFENEKSDWDYWAYWKKKYSILR
jgi:hypothetical protein